MLELVTTYCTKRYEEIYETHKTSLYYCECDQNKRFSSFSKDARVIKLKKSKENFFFDFIRQNPSVKLKPPRGEKTRLNDIKQDQTSTKWNPNLILVLILWPKMH